VRIGDVAATMAAMLEASRDLVHAQTYNVGTDALNIQVRDIASMIAEEIPHTTVSLAAHAGPDERSYRASFRKLAGSFPELRFETDLRVGIRSLISAFEAADLRHETLVSGRYARLAVIKKRISDGELDDALRATGAGRSTTSPTRDLTSSRAS
jgi:hypothetical protein